MALTTRLKNIYNKLGFSLIAEIVFYLLCLIAGIACLTSCSAQEDILNIENPGGVPNDTTDYITLDFTLNTNSLLNNKTRTNDLDYELKFHNGGNSGVYLYLNSFLACQDGFTDTPLSFQFTNMTFSPLSICFRDTEKQKFILYDGTLSDKAEYQTIYTFDENISFTKRSFRWSFPKNTNPSKVILFVNHYYSNYTNYANDLKYTYIDINLNNNSAGLGGYFTIPIFETKYPLSLTNDWNNINTDIKIKFKTSFIFIITDEFETNRHSYIPEADRHFECKLFSLYDNISKNRSFKDYFKIDLNSVNRYTSFFKAYTGMYNINNNYDSDNMTAIVKQPCVGYSTTGCLLNYMNIDYLKNYCNSTGIHYPTYDKRYFKYNNNLVTIIPLQYLPNNQNELKVADINLPIFDDSLVFNTTEVGDKMDVLKLYLIPYYKIQTSTNARDLPDVPFFYSNIPFPQGGFKSNCIYIIKNKPNTNMFNYSINHWNDADYPSITKSHDHIDKSCDNSGDSIINSNYEILEFEL